ncbi:RecT-like ssDNA annealing protein [Klebsiella phage Solomon]|uniref:RecT-like ssDNA annealing protein n=1 Tax=Klebsiella phage Solomon TaxID=2767583 RepID=A0A873WVE0_9CAUD|nr:RecT-like ssDNA annealing protein [Klebsiella phage Solomon]
MRTSEKFTTVAAALIQAKSKFVAAKKSGKNNHLGNTYANLGDILDAITPALSENKIMVIQSMMDTSTEKVMHLETMFLHESGEFMAFQYNMPISKTVEQAYGSTTSYARRYALAAALGIKQADDDAEITKMKPQDFKKRIDACNDLEALREIYKLAKQTLTPAEWKITEDDITKRQAELTVTPANGFNPGKPQKVAKQEPEKVESKPEPESQDISSFN